MTQEKEKKERVRKAYSPDGTRGQKHISFRCDNENLEWLNKQANKGRYLNNLIEADREAQEQ